MMSAEPRILPGACRTTLQAEKLATYATGRGMGFSDRKELRTLVAQTARSDYGFRELLHAVIQSSLFLNK